MYCVFHHISDHLQRLILFLQILRKVGLWSDQVLRKRFSMAPLREGVKKNGKKAVRLTAWVDPPPPPPPKRSRKCEIFSTSCHIWGYFAIL